MALLCVAGVAVAAEMKEEKAAAMTKPAITRLSELQPLQRATHLLDLPIRNPDKSLEGVVKDIILSADRTHAEFLAVRFVGLPDRVITVPFDGVRCTSDGKELVCEFKREGINLASGFNANKWPYEYANLRVSTLLKLDVHDTSGASVAKLRDLLIDTADTRVTEATVSVGGFMGIGEKLASVAWDTVRFADNAKYAEILLGNRVLRSLAYRESDYWQHLGFGDKDMEPEPTPTRDSGWPPAHYGY